MSDYLGSAELNRRKREQGEPVRVCLGRSVCVCGV
jgi:hypothetical protein